MTRDADVRSDQMSLLASAPCGLLTINNRGEIIAANTRLGEWLGLPVSQLRGTLLAQHLTKASRIVFETSIVPMLTLKGKIDGTSIDLVDGQGAKIPVSLSAEVSGTGDSSVTTFVFLLADARRAYERDLAQARLQAETLLSSSQKEGELREQFIAILGHDLRNPLASIASSMNILSREPLSSRADQIMTLTKGSVQRMSLLIDNVLDFARNRLGGGMELEITAGAALESEIRQVVDELRSAHPDRRIEVHIADADTVACDVSRIGQLLSNLLGNAITYGDPSQPIHVEAGKSDNGFELSVRNAGAPIAAAAIDRLFDPFKRSTNHEDREGLGLGLYIASEIAKAHEGSLSVHSDAVETKFTLRLPKG